MIVTVIKNTLRSKTGVLTNLNIINVLISEHPTSSIHQTPVRKMVILKPKYTV